MTSKEIEIVEENALMLGNGNEVIMRHWKVDGKPKMKLEVCGEVYLHPETAEKLGSMLIDWAKEC